jgi:hypothetical protein
MPRGLRDTHACVCMGFHAAMVPDSQCSCGIAGPSVSRPVSFLHEHWGGCIQDAYSDQHTGEWTTELTTQQMH